MTARRSRTIGALLLFAVVAGFYALTFSYRAITDTDLNSLQTRALVLHGDVDLSRYESIPGASAQLVTRNGHMYAIYGVGISTVAAPLYAILVRAGVSDQALQATAGIVTSAAAVALIGVLLMRLAPPIVATAATIVFAFGTTLWTVASTAFFQQSAVLAFLCVGLLGLFSNDTRGPIVAGAGLGIATFIRPTIAIPLAIVGLVYATRGRRAIAGYAFGAALPLVALLIQNRWIWGEWLSGGYSHTGVGFNADAPNSLVGLTIGWWRGLFVYSPVLIIGVVGWILALPEWRRDRELKLAALGLSSLVTLLFYSKWDDWGGGVHQFGYRLQLEIVPFLVVLGVYAVARMPRLSLAAAALGLLSIVTMTWGAAPSRNGFDSVLFASEFGDTSIARAWNNFFDQPLPGLVRLGGVAVVGFLTLAVIRRGASASPALFSRREAPA